MTLIKSISGIRGTIGGKQGTALTPLDVVKFTTAYARYIQKRSSKTNIKVVVGRDARISGDMVNRLVTGTLMGMGAHVIDLGLSTTPTVELAVPDQSADGGIILTASHNPRQWNALKLLNEKGEFLSAEDGQEVLNFAEEGSTEYADIDLLGNVALNEDYIQEHVDHVLGLDLVNKEVISKGKLKVVIDCVNSSGSVFLPPLLKALGVSEVVKLFCEPNGNFPHNPEPLPENLKEISARVMETGAHLGIVVDPDVDRLAFVCEDGTMFGEEYTLVAVADYILSKTPGNTVSNLSSTRALRDVTEKHGGKYFGAAVGEVNVVNKMKEVEAVIGGEGNGGVIYPESHYGRDALVGIGLFLTHLVSSGLKISELRDSLPSYTISKNKIELTPEIDVDLILSSLEKQYSSEDLDTTDGVKINFAKEWVHLRKSNTEPIIRIYAESSNASAADALATRFIDEIKKIAGI